MKLIVMTCATALLASTAFAGGFAAPVADSIVASPAMAGANWSGAYAGGTFAFATGANDYSEDDIYSLDGTAYGVFAGYRRDMGNFVLGGEAAVLFANGIGETDEGDTYTYTSIIDLKATAGYDLGSVLVYATAGYSISDFDQEEPNTMTGFLIGAGVDVKIGERFFVGAEYIYRDMKNDDFYGTDDGIRGQVSTMQIRAGVNF
ncbi:MAG: porin family protein [Rhodobacteraceae bacterium]|nr:porin family protein [Paracoccaceae bacterium]